MSLRSSFKVATLPFALAAFALLTAVSNDRAMAHYPDRIVRIIVPFAPGG